MVHRAASAVPSYERDACRSRGAYVDLLPWVLVPADDDARHVAVQKQQRLLRSLMAE